MFRLLSVLNQLSGTHPFLGHLRFRISQAATDLASFTQQSLNPDPEVTELPFELTASVMSTTTYSLAKESTDLD